MLANIVEKLFFVCLVFFFFYLKQKVMIKKIIQTQLLCIF